MAHSLSPKWMLLIEMASVMILFELKGPRQEKNEKQNSEALCLRPVKSLFNHISPVTALFKLTHNREPTALREAELILL
jgi:hypothetical protein